ncbi:autoinducer 2 ABC transporter substrate-binding protein, partial [Escherichia coli]
GFFPPGGNNAQQTSKKLGVDVTPHGPTKPNVSCPVQLLHPFFHQNYNAILVSSVLPGGLFPSLKHATQHGVRALAWDS